jgi:hypothetical protein
VLYLKEVGAIMGDNFGIGFVIGAVFSVFFSILIYGFNYRADADDLQQAAKHFCEPYQFFSATDVKFGKKYGEKVVSCYASDGGEGPLQYVNRPDK